MMLDILGGAQRRRLRVRGFAPWSPRVGAARLKTNGAAHEGSALRLTGSPP
jgi:hypothetical protein